ncbi:MAG: efflux RND transporter periplasmic adaptor subunit [Gemmatimonadetes bacterium]|nr:efflux RND transporter periplasmic adaptor subunit [Gemmatimonadota bacterium]
MISVPGTRPGGSGFARVGPGGSGGPHPPRLPDPPVGSELTGRLLRRAVNVLFALLLVLMAGAAAVAFLVEVDDTVDGSGVLLPRRVWPVRAIEPGIVRRVLVGTGDRVRAGELLVQLDSLKLATELAQLRAQYDSRRIQLDRAEAALPYELRQKSAAREESEAKRLAVRADLREALLNYSVPGDPDSVLARYRPGSHVVIDRTLSQLRVADAGVRDAEAQEALGGLEALDLRRQRAELRQLAVQIRSTEEELARLSIRAPAAGIVATERLERLPGAFTHEGDSLMEILEPGSWRADVLVSERDVHEVHVGDPARVEIRAFRAATRELVEGRVRSVAAEPADAGTQGAAGPPAPGDRYRVTIDLDPAAVERIGVARMRMGYTVEGKIVTGRRRIAEMVWRYLRKQTG